MKQLVLAALAAALTGCAGVPATAGSLVDVAVINRATGQRIPTHYHQGRHYIAGTPGERYAIYVANRTGARVMAVMSVDGINVVTGETAAASQAGYVLAPHQSFEITGWRKSTTEVAAFYFTALPDSYAARTDRPGNVGVIGVAVFQEWRPPRPALSPHSAPPVYGEQSMHGRARAEAPAERQSADSSAPSGADAPADAARSAAPYGKREEKLGTGHGERERSHVRYTDFRRATSAPAETTTIHYDSYRNLLARGVIRRAPPVVEPDPFPGGRFVPDIWG